MSQRSENPVREQNRASAAVWGAGGHDYDQVSFAISDALAHAAQRLAPARGDKVLDCATGTGWTARNVARMGAAVSAIDIASELLAAARALSAGFQPDIQYRLADVEDLPYRAGEMNGVISTFGVMFAADHGRAAAELARVCAKGGRLVLATWAPAGAVAEFFGLIGAYSRAPAPQASPLAWGEPDYLRKLFGDSFDLTFEAGTNRAYHESPEAIWQWYLRGFGPVRWLHDQLDAADQQAFKRDVDAYHAHYRVEAGLCVKRDYLITIGRRR